MLTMNHTAVFFLKALREFKEENQVMSAENYLDANISLLLLPDAIRMYGPRQQFHFTEHPITKEVSSVKFTTSPYSLKGIKDAFESDLKADIPKCVIDELSHPEIFSQINPTWEKTAYASHLYQDCAWDKWIREMVDVSKRFEDTFTYITSNEVVDGVTFRQQLGPLDNIFFKKVVKTIYEEFGILINEEWFEKHVYSILLKEYDKELAENTWKYIKLPSLTEDFALPSFLLEKDLSKAVKKMVDATILY